jgi:hypothetical protein
MLGCKVATGVARWLMGLVDGRSTFHIGWTILWLVASILVFFFVVLIYSQMLDFAPHFYAVGSKTWNLPLIWLEMFLVPVICVGNDIVWSYLGNEFRPSPDRIGIEHDR